MGLHRSGTTILYKILYETGYFNKLTLYHVMYYDSLLYNYINKNEFEKKKNINKLLKEKEIITRQTDDVKVDADYEHEYGYILQNKGKSVFIDNKNKELMIQICKKIKFTSNNNKYILLKNPHDFGNFLLIKHIFPNAKFIFIHRNPSYAISSSMRLWKTHLLQRNKFLEMYSNQYKKIYSNPLSRILFRLFYASKFPIGVFDIIQLAKKNTSKYVKNIDKLEKNDYISLKYEDICKNPNDVMDHLLDFLNLEKNMDFSRYIKARELSLTREVKFLNKYIYDVLEEYCDYFDYK